MMWHRLWLWYWCFILKILHHTTININADDNVDYPQFYDVIHKDGVYTEDIVSYVKLGNMRGVTLLNPIHLCDVDETDEDLAQSPYLVVIIYSHPDNKPRRDAIRNTWGRRISRMPDVRAEMLFVVGVTGDYDQNYLLEKEAKLYKDVMQFNVKDTYSNLVIKSILSVRWLNVYCNRADFVLKTDDDMYINIDLLVGILRTHSKNNTLIGSVYEHSRVLRSGLWAVDPTVYSYSQFPPYCSGTAYVMTLDIVAKLAQYRPLTHIIPIEDAYITGILANNVSTVCKHDGRFPDWMTTPKVANVELFYQNLLVGIHGLPYEKMYQLWNRTLYEEFIPKKIMNSV